MLECDDSYLGKKVVRQWVNDNLFKILISTKAS